MEEIVLSMKTEYETKFEAMTQELEKEKLARKKAEEELKKLVQ